MTWGGRAEWQDVIRGGGIPDRIWFILDSRFGTPTRLTLQEVGDTLGVSRERVRQLESQGIRMLRQQTGKWHPSLGGIEDVLAAEATRETERDLLSTRHFVARVLSLSNGAVDDRDARRLLVALRALGSVGASESLWPTLSFCACVLAPAIERHVGVREHFAAVARRARERTRESSYREMARRVLCLEEAPLHWRRIAERCEALKERTIFSESSCFNALQSYADVFVRVGPGTYALSIWGFQKGEYLNDLIAGVLHGEGRCLEYADVLHRVRGRQEARATSVSLTLSMHVRFYRAVSGRFGLRAWLQPRERQTLRTPKDRVEAPVSVRRVQRARAQGYDVEGIVARDRERDGR